MAEFKPDRAQMDIELAKIVRRELGRIALAVEAEAKRRAVDSRDTGNLIRSISSYYEPVGFGRYVVQASAHYAKFVELGTRAHFPPPAALARWAKKRGISPFAVAKAIARRGTPAQPFLRPALYAIAARLKVRRV